MPVRDRSVPLLRTLLLAGASASALLVGSAQMADAGGLRDRSSANSAAAAATAAAQAGAQAAAAAAAQAMNRVNTSLQSLRTQQAAARAAAQSAAAAVPNGLAPGGLVVAPGAVPGPTNGGAGLWQGANLPTQRASANGRTQVEVTQTEQKAILTWKSFNVGRETDLYFNQTAGGANASNWIALNRVLDPSASPSRILGNIKADGQVYIINQNGIIFGGASQVNVNTLVASSLSLSNAQFMAGINKDLYVFNDTSGNSIAMPQFGYLGQQQPINGKSINDPTQVARAVFGDAPGDVQVEAGAQITMTSGGKAMLFAPRVFNAGQISAPDGQVIMAAGEQIYLRTNVDRNTRLSTFPGLDVAASSPMPWVFSYSHMIEGCAFCQDLKNIVLPEMEARAASVGYRVVNNGVVQADHGNVTITARDVIQNGAVLASTALNNRSGSIRLQGYSQGMGCYSSSFCDPGAGIVWHWSTGTVTLSPGSVTAAMPDLSDTSEIELTSLATRYKPGRVELRGNLINIERDANVVVPAGTISVVASTDSWAEEAPVTGDRKRDGSRIYVGEGAYLSVAGLQGISLAMERNVIEADLRINELRDSPLYRDSWLRGQKVTIDRRMTGRFADGPMAGVQWVQDKNGNYIPGAWVGTPLADVSDWVGVGKTDLGELSTVGGAIVIKSGGSIITRQGSLLDVSGGSVRYRDGMVNTTKLLGADGRVYDIGQASPDRIYVGVAGQFTRTHGRAGLTETWTSTLRAGRRVEPGYTEGRAAGALQFYATEGVALEGEYWGGVIAGERQAATGKLAAAGTLTFGGDGDEDRQWLLGNVVISHDPALLPAGFNATTPLPLAWYSGSPTNDESFRLRTTHLDADTLAKAEFGKIELYVSANVTLEQGTTLQLRPDSAFSILANSGDAYTQDFRINGVIRVAGGDVKLRFGENVSFGSAGGIDVSAQWVNEWKDGASAQPTAIEGGTIEVMNARLEPGAVLDVSGGGLYRWRGGKLDVKFGDAGTIDLQGVGAAELMAADLRGYAAGSGGSLLFTTVESLQIGGDTPAAGTVRLPETLFADRGFRSVQMTSAGAITVSPGASIAQQQRTVDLRGVDLSRVASGTPMRSMGPLAVLPLSQRLARKPTSLTLVGDAITIGAGATVRTDIGGRIALSSPDTNGGAIEIAGRLEAPGGAISATTENGPVTVRGSAALVANGLAVIEPDLQGLRNGVVLDGGSVLVSGTRVTFEAGSMVDVSGASGEIDVPGASRSGVNPVVTLASNGGKISVSGDGLIESLWHAHGGGSGARGGTATLAPETGSPMILSEGAAAQAGLVVRPSTIQSSGVADLVIDANGRAVRLDGVQLALGSLISIKGTLVNGNSSDSSLSAAYISLDGAVSGTASPQGTLTLVAAVINAKVAYIRGFAQTVLEAADIQLAPTTVGQAGLLDADGTLVLRAAQIYPGSQTSATIKAGDKIIVQQNGVAGLALSAAGSLTLEAPVIEQNGTLRAPFGQITLRASQRLTLGAGSVTAVSGDGLVLPYGNLLNDENWTVVNGTITIAKPPEKRITLDAPSVDLAGGSVVDIRGGGDLFAWEHVPGPGGSHDVLTRPGIYAIVPVLNNTVAPADANTRAGDRIWLDGGNGVAAGWYSLLPARYAMLPGAYAVQMIDGSQGAAPARSARMSDGGVVMTGFRGNAYDGSQEQLRSSWRVMSGATVRRYSEYNEAFANTFFASDAFRLTQYRQTGLNVLTPRLPMDGGAVVFKATQDLILNGQLRSQGAAGGRGGLVDIASQKIAIVGEDQSAGTLRADGYLVIGATALSNFGAGSVLIGGVRSGDALGMRVDVTADHIIVRNSSGTALTGSEIILAASETIDIGAGSVIAARGEAPTDGGDLVMAPQVPQTPRDNDTPNDPTDDFVSPSRDWGALIRVSNGEVVRVRRENVDTTVGGQVTIGAGAVLDGGEALLIDATRNAVVTRAQLSGQSLSLAAGRIGFGGGSGLVLDAAALAALRNTQHLTLRSYSSIDFHRSVDLSGLKAVTFDTAALVGYGNNAVSVVGNRLVLENTASTFAEPVGAGHGSLSFATDELAFGLGAKALRGFDTVVLSGATRIVGEGNGSFDAGAATVTLSAPVLTGRGAAGQSITTTGALIVAATGASPVRDENSLGARWTLTGGSVAFGGRIDALGGAVELTATSGNVVLANGSLIDVGGFAKQYFDAAEYADAGRISLSAVAGSVVMGSGAVLDLTAHPAGGGAGTLAIVSSGTGIALDGTIKAQAAPGQRGASFSLDVGALANFGALNQRLSESGFSKSREFRVRTGDVTLDGATVVESLVLAADQGHVTVAGTVDARASYGGAIEIYGGNGLTVTSTAVLRAGATDTVDHLGSGRITLGITGGALSVQGGLIDVAGGEGGKVTLRAPVIEQPGPDTVNVSFAGTIAGAREIVLEGYKRFDLATLAADPRFVGVTINSSGQAELDLAATASGKLNVLADYGAGTLVEFVRDFDISAAYGTLGGLASQPNFHARPGMELNHSGDIVLKSNWNLGAGIVDEAGAVAAGLMGVDTTLNKFYVIPGRQVELLTNHTTMVYRTGGSIFGEPGVLTMRAEGNIELKGSITDGFFQFADPLDVDYLAKANSTVADYTLLVNGGFNNGAGATALTRWRDYTAWTSTPGRYLALGFGRWTSDIITHSPFSQIPASSLHVPYSAAANAPAAHGTLPGGGDPLKHSEMFPGVTSADGQTSSPTSWSYALVAGAAPAGSSASPMQRAAGAAGSIVLKEQPTYTYTSNPCYCTGQVLIDLNPAFSTTSDPTLDLVATKSLKDWLSDFTDPSKFAGVSDDATAVFFAGHPAKDLDPPGLPSNPARPLIQALWQAFVAENRLVPNDSDPAKGFAVIDSGGTSGYALIMPVATFKKFITGKIIPNLEAIRTAYPLAGAVPMPGSATTTTRATTVVRTGTGDVTLAASGNVRLDGQASIYTAGRRDLAVYSDFTTAPASAVYGVGGGHVQMRAGGSVSVKLPEDRTKMQHYVEWLLRQGVTDASGVFSPTEQSSWWVDYGSFERGIGALGGGNVTVSAGGDLDNLMVALPTNGRVRGGRTASERKLLEMRNGGAMTVTAGGSVRAGYYYVGRGAGTIEAGDFAVGRTVTRNDRGSISTYAIAPILSLGDATLDVRTAGDLFLQTLLDPLLVRNPSNGGYMSGMTDRSALSLTSVGGDVTLVGQVRFLSKDLTYFSERDNKSYEEINNYAANLYPSKTRITALNGSVQNGAVMNMLPGTMPELRIVADEDVMPGAIVMGRGVLDLMASPLNPRINLDSVLYNDIIGPGMNDYEPSRIYARAGTIFIGNIYTNEQTWFRAGKDIRDINYHLRNLRPTDVSLLEAGNDIIGGTGSVGSAARLNEPFFGGQVEIVGPGALVLTAGRDVYGTNFELYSRGNQKYDKNNRVIPGTKIAGLPDEGASITVMAGLKGRQPSYEAFMAAYLDPANVAAMPDYLKIALSDGTMVPLYLSDAVETRSSGTVKTVRSGLVSFVETVTGETLSPLDAWARFKTLPQLTQERFVRQVYMQELREAGTDQLSPGADGQPRNGGYNRGYAAVETLFPGKDWKGDVTVGNALFRTMAGGDIEVLTPGGGLQVAALRTDVAKDYGLVTLGYGHINIFARNNVVVNRSRVLTFAGGDEIIWSSLGDIDAGRGAKTVRVPSAPEIQTDVNAVTKVLEKADISGSGIGTIIGFAGVEEGDVHLIAPEGTVNAGDAGVRVSGNLTVGARFVLNVDNFDVAGEVKGVPKQEARVAPLSVETKDKAAADAVRDVTQQATPSERPSVIIVEILGYGGGESERPQDRQQGDEQRRREQHSYNPSSAVQFVGAGTLTDDQRRRLTATGGL